MIISEEISNKHLDKMKEAKKQFEKGADNEWFHIKMDNELLMFIKELGYEDIFKEYEDASKYFWYA